MTTEVPPPRFAVLLGFEDIQQNIDDGKERTVDVYDWHYNHRLYEHLGSARSYATQGHGFGGSTKSLVIKVDPAICEPDGMDPQAEYEFCERMMDYWGGRAAAARKKAEGTDTAQPRPKRTRGKGTAKRRRKQQNKIDSLTKKLLIGAGAVVLGNAISNMLTKSNETPITQAAPFGLPIPKGPNDK